MSRNPHTNACSFSNVLSLNICAWSASTMQVWVKPGAEMSFLYGNHVLKSGLGRITENTAQNQASAQVQAGLHNGTTLLH